MVQLSLSTPSEKENYSGNGGRSDTHHKSITEKEGETEKMDEGDEKFEGNANVCYQDLSPKGSVDKAIRPLLTEINSVEGLVTTSSCAGRVSVFVEGEKEVVATTNTQGREYENEGEAQIEVGFGKDGDSGEDDVNNGPVPGGIEAPKKASAIMGNRETNRKGSKITKAGVGGKGGGGKWLFVSHEPLELFHQSHGDKDWATVFGLTHHPVLTDEMQQQLKTGTIASSTTAKLGDKRKRWIHFKFEPMILHILAASSQHAQLVLKCAFQAGFRESGAHGLVAVPSSAQKKKWQCNQEDLTAEVTPMVAVRAAGLAFESIIGYHESWDSKDAFPDTVSINDDSNNSMNIPIVGASYLDALVNIANERFKENNRRIERFRYALQEEVSRYSVSSNDKRDRKLDWEDTIVRRERKRAEGLKRAEKARQKKIAGQGAAGDNVSDDSMSLGFAETTIPLHMLG